MRWNWRLYLCTVLVLTVGIVAIFAGGISFPDEHTNMFIPFLFPLCIAGGSIPLLMGLLQRKPGFTLRLDKLAVVCFLALVYWTIGKVDISLISKRDALILRQALLALIIIYSFAAVSFVWEKKRFEITFRLSACLIDLLLACAICAVCLGGAYLIIASRVHTVECLTSSPYWQITFWPLRSHLVFLYWEYQPDLFFLCTLRFLLPLFFGLAIVLPAEDLRSRLIALIVYAVLGGFAYYAISAFIMRGMWLGKPVSTGEDIISEYGWLYPLEFLLMLLGMALRHLIPPFRGKGAVWHGKICS